MQGLNRRPGDAGSLFADCFKAAAETPAQLKAVHRTGVRAHLAASAQATGIRAACRSMSDAASTGSSRAEAAQMTLRASGDTSLPGSAGSAPQDSTLQVFR